jgi:glycosyltransferase involved in cell wall biosynthesis
VRRLLVLSFFPAFTPPASGGELRYFNLYARLSKRFDVTLLSPTYSHGACEMVTHSASFREHRIPKEPLHDRLHMEIAQDALADECSALVCALASRVPNRYHDAYLDLQADADVIVHESPYMLDHDLLLGLDGRPRIYNSYNVESDLVAQMWKGPAAARYVEYVTGLERRLVTASDLTLAVSDEDARRLAEKFGVERARIAIAPNGVTVDELMAGGRSDGRRLTALFFGSFHPPNIEAARYILTTLAPSCAGVDFVIAGGCLAGAPPDCPPNVRVRGRVDDAERRALLAQADIALNPMFTGGGTNLKALEFLAAGLPLVTTGLGARGLDLVDGAHALVADGNDFGAALARLVAQPAVRAQLGRGGREYVRHRFDWDAIAEAVGERLEAVAARPPVERRTLLVLNNFSAATPTSGGEVRINRIYRHLASEYRIASVCLTDAPTLARTEIAPGSRRATSRFRCRRPPSITPSRPRCAGGGRCRWTTSSPLARPHATRCCVVWSWPYTGSATRWCWPTRIW